MINTSWGLIGEISSRFAKLGLVWILARSLTPEQFGSYNYIIAFVALFSFIFDFGITTNATIDISQKKVNAFQRYFVMKFFVVIIGLILIYVSAIFYKDIRIDIDILVLAGVFTGLVELASYILTLYRANNAFILESKWRFLNGILQLLFGGVAVLISDDLRFLFAALIASQVLMMLPLAWNLMKLPSHQGSIFISVLDSDRWRKCFPLALIALSGSLVSNIDTIFIAKYVSLDQIALYSLSVKIVYGLLLMPAAYLQLATLSNMSRLLSGVEDDKKSRELWAKYFIVFVWLSGGVIVASVYLMKYFINFAFGPQYIDAIPYCLALTLSIFVTYITVPMNQWLLLKNQRWVLVLIGAVGALIMVVSLFLLTPSLKLWAGILSAMISNLFVLIISILRIRYLENSLLSLKCALHAFICITVGSLVSAPGILPYLKEMY